MRKVIETGLLLAALVGAAQSPKDSLVPANAALQAGEADKALAVLSSLPASAESHNLKCRVFLTLERWDEALAECQQAADMDRDNSMDHMWLGRALGEKASRAPFTSAFSLAKRVRAEFEEAVRLDGRNAEALANLGEFYSAAPGIVGGGTDKAEGVAAQLDKVDAVRAHQLRGQIAESNKDYGSAEREFKQAVAASQHPSVQWMALASFYRRRERLNDMEEALQSGVKAAQSDKRSGVALFNGASVLIRAKTNLTLAAKMLEDYLAGSSKTEEAPAFEAYTKLAQIKAQSGDKAGAQQDRAKALELAHDYKPALQLKF